MRDIVCFSLNNWEKRKARKQQLMTALAKRPDTGTVLYVEPPVNYFRLLVMRCPDVETRTRKKRALSGEAERIGEKLWVYTPVFLVPFSFKSAFIHRLNLAILVPALRTCLAERGMRDILLWFYQPLDLPLRNAFGKGVPAVFDWAEEWEAYFTELSAPMRAAVSAMEEELCRRATVVFTVSHRLLERASKLNPRSVFLQDGTDAEVFTQPSYDPVPGLEGLPRPVIGYLGSLHHRFDAALVAYAAGKLPGYSFVLVGAHDPSRLDVAALRRCPNVHFTGEQPYEKLGAYARYFDVCMLPYKPELTSAFPTKLYDYFATGKPVVSTPLVELASFREHLSVASGPDEFVEALRAAAAAGPQGAAERIALARSHDWTRTAAEAMRSIGEAAS